MVICSINGMDLVLTGALITTRLLRFERKRAQYESTTKNDSVPGTLGHIKYEDRVA